MPKMPKSASVIVSVDIQTHHFLKIWAQILPTKFQSTVFHLVQNFVKVIPYIQSFLHPFDRKYRSATTPRVHFKLTVFL